MPKIKRKPAIIRLVDAAGAYDYTDMNPIVGWRVRRAVTVVGDLFGPGIDDQDIEDTFYLFRMFNEHLFILTTCHEARYERLRSSLRMGRNVRVLVDTQGDNYD